MYLLLHFEENALFGADFFFLLVDEVLKIIDLAWGCFPLLRQLVKLCLQFMLLFRKCAYFLVSRELLHFLLLGLGQSVSYLSWKHLKSMEALIVLMKCDFQGCFCPCEFNLQLSTVSLQLINLLSPLSEFLLFMFQHVMESSHFFIPLL